MRVIIFVYIFFYSLNLLGQVTFAEQPQVENLMARYISLGKEEDHINGWRIKLVSTTDRRKMERTNYAFRQQFPSLSPNSKYENPYYSLKVGAFENRFDLEPLLAEIKLYFPEAIPFRDRVLKSELFDR